MSKINIQVIQPSKIKISGEYDHIIIPGVDGDFGVSSEHTPFITKIRPGILHLYKGTQITDFAIHDGFVTVENNSIKIVCETIESSTEIKTKRAESSKERAEKRLKNPTEGIDFRRAEASLKRALVRLSLTKK
ncbi:MAG TPA: ATP synthase F1 subunit epsilon [Candidatus Cloacimonetes bacterium]|nr:ATP synthase F1 subunit epsilon [Candidatus Cloacimonadota bacterium]